MQQVLEPVRVPAAPEQVEQDARIEVAGPGAHDQALQRRQPHRGVDRQAATDGRCGGAVAEVQGHQAQLAGVTAEDLGGFARDVLVADAVHAEAPDAGLPGDLAVHRVGRRGGRKVGEPRRVEDGDLREVGPGLPGQPDTGQRGRVVQRCELGELLQLAQRLVVDPRRTREAARRRARPGGPPLAGRRRRPPGSPLRPARRPPRARSRRVARPSHGRWTGRSRDRPPGTSATRSRR